MTRICVFGAGAVGSHVAVRMAALPEVELSLVARGSHLRAIREHGLTLQTDTERLTARIPMAVDDPAVLPPQDLVIVSLKTTALPAQAGAIASLLKPEGAALFLNNGIPWWWQYGLSAAAPLDLLDPDHALWRLLTPQRAIGGVVYSPNELEGPGMVRHRGHNRFLLGEPDLRQSPRLLAIRDLFQAAGLAPELPADIRLAIWQKLLLNVPASPISALTRLGTAERAADASLQALNNSMQQELRAIASAMGWQLPPFIDKAPIRPQAGQSLNARPSMLQDVLRGRPLEVEALLGQPLAFARQYGVPTPALDVLYPLLRGLDRALSASPLH